MANWWWGPYWVAEYLDTRRPGQPVVVFENDATAPLDVG